MGVRVLIVEDFTEWSHLLCSMLQSRQEFRVVGLVSNGLQATLSAEELQPDLILLDIGLPGLNGIAAARKITRIAARSKIIFISENQEPEVVREALASGAHGYIFKSHIASELFPAIEAVLGNCTFVSDYSTPKTLLK
jgi:DNA-binding NarL/FixJ family response regulator